MVIAGILPHLLFYSSRFLNVNFHDMICLVNTNYIFNLNHVNVEEFYL